MFSLIVLVCLAIIILAVEKTSEYKRQKQTDRYWQSVVDEWNNNPNNLAKLIYSKENK
jgi:hypothetical protein